jgi:hypothetical protein
MDAVVVLKNPKLEEDQLTFDVDVLEGGLRGADGAAARCSSISWSSDFLLRHTQGRRSPPR